MRCQLNTQSHTNTLSSVEYGNPWMWSCGKSPVRWQIRSHWKPSSTSLQRWINTRQTCRSHTPAHTVLPASASSVSPHSRQDKEEGDRKRTERKMGGNTWRGRVVPAPPVPPAVLLLVTLATLPEFHKSLRRSRKWLLGFGMSLSGHCRHRWILCGLPRPSLPLPPPTLPLLFPLFLPTRSPFSSTAAQSVDSQISQFQAFCYQSKMWLMVLWCRLSVGSNEALGFFLSFFLRAVCCFVHHFHRGLCGQLLKVP